MTSKDSAEQDKSELAGDPVPAVAVTQQGSTFAERAAAAKKASAKAVDEDSVEDKSVSSARTKSRRKA
jgi:hypothetical protein